MIRKILTALAALSLSATVGGTLAAPALAITVPVVSQDVDVAYSSGFPTICNLELWIGVPGSTGHIGGSTPVPTCATFASGTSPSYVTLANGTEVIAFHGSNGNLWTFRQNPGTNGTLVDQNVPMMSGTSPSITIDGANNAVAFQGSNGDLWTWLGSGGSRNPAVDQKLPMMAGTSPSIGAFSSIAVPAGEVSVAFQGSDGDLWSFLGQPGQFFRTLFDALNTGLGMASGTSPALTNTGAFARVAFQANTGILWTWAGDDDGDLQGGGISTGLAMAAGTSPAITDGVGFDGEDSEVAFQDNNGRLSLWTGEPDDDNVAHAELDLGVAPGTSPSITTVQGEAGVAFQASSTGVLWTVLANVTSTGTAFLANPAGCPNQLACPASELPMGIGTSPSIVAAIPPPAGLSLTAKGDILARLRKPRTLVLLVYSERHAHKRLLGRVALGNHPAGVSRIRWGLRVDGHRLGPGDYLAELEARIGASLTVGGPTVSFEVRRGGRLRIGLQSCAARASTC
jgi:hypothetical protein